MAISEAVPGNGSTAPWTAVNVPQYLSWDLLSGVLYLSGKMVAEPERYAASATRGDRSASTPTVGHHSKAHHGRREATRMVDGVRRPDSHGGSHVD